MPPRGIDRRAVLAAIAASVSAVPGCLDAGGRAGGSDGTGSPSFRLRLENRSGRRQTVEVTLAVLTDDGEASDESTAESYSLEPEERLYLDDRFEPSTNYQVAVSVDGGATERWILHDYAGLAVVIESADRIDAVVAEA